MPRVRDAGAVRVTREIVHLAHAPRPRALESLVAGAWPGHPPLESTLESGDDLADATMHINFPTALIVSALIASIVLVTNRGDRIVPVIAFIAAGLEALMAFGILTLALGHFRIDVILPGLLLVTGAICWSRASSKPAITAATVLALVGAIQLVLALRLLT